MRHKAILFDLDGILVNACEIHYEALNMALQEVSGTQIDRKDHEMTYNGLSTHQKLSRLVRVKCIDADDQDRIYQAKQKHTLKAAREVIKPDDRVEMLHTLSKDYRIGCVSNCIRKSVDLLLRLANLDDFIVVSVSNEDVDCPKPSPEPYQIAIREFHQLGFNFPASEFIAVEDNLRGVQSAGSAGLRVLQYKEYGEMTLSHLQANLK